MRFSVRQILASAAGAVIAAVIASIFGVKGTIVGVAIGSAAATMGTAFVAQSIERGQHAVKQVVVRAPESSTLLRKLGGTGASGDAASSVDAASAPTEAVRQPGTQSGSGPETTKMESAAAPAGVTERLEISAVADAPATERLPRHHRSDAAGGGSARCAPVLLANHRGDGCHRVRAGPPVHHGRRADLGQAALGDLRRSGHRDHAEQPRQLSGCGYDDHHHTHLDHVDHDELVHDHDHVDARHDHDEHRSDSQIDDHDLAGVLDHHDDGRGCDIVDDVCATALRVGLTSP